MAENYASTDRQRAALYNLKSKGRQWISNETEKLTQRIDRMKINYQGYNKMKSKIVSKGVSSFYDDDMKVFCVERKLERNYYNTEDEGYQSLPPIPVSFDENTDDINGNLISVPQQRRHSMFPTMESNGEWRFNFFFTILN